MMIGHESRLSYDSDTYSDRLKESVSPLNYRVNSNQIFNQDRCLSTLGPRNSASSLGHGGSSLDYSGYAEAMVLTDLESVLSNRNVRSSRSSNGKTNPINPLTVYKTTNARICDNGINGLNPSYTKLSHPPINYKEVEFNRFYNLVNDAQEPIFYDFASNSRLEIKDNHIPDYPMLWPELTGPRENTSKNQSCSQYL